MKINWFYFFYFRMVVRQPLTDDDDLKADSDVMISPLESFLEYLKRFLGTGISRNEFIFCTNTHSSLCRYYKIWNYEICWYTEGRKQRKVVQQPLSNVRYDRIGHLPHFMDEKFASKCRFEGCKSRLRVICTKCNMYLCVLKIIVLKNFMLNNM